MVSLGFQTGYVAQGGDIGSMVSQRLAQDYPECCAIHCMSNNITSGFSC
jgi:microsomal epoxide hydrolase